MTTLPVNVGWVQYSQSYSDKATCESAIEDNKAEIVMDVAKFMGVDSKTGKPRFKYAKDFECMSYEEAVRRNTELGH